MTLLSFSDDASPAERLNFISNLLELALYAPPEEVTSDGKAAIQIAARQVVVLSAEVTEKNYSVT